ncbi:uncharacterized protein SETTUDRAFT_175630 [Exserohilum turcica Et28A]|uniref:Uncharacterized protein n=1 Tax=Exserohilum turcicum (strain 28A) TaxID=671987 RepID=R0KNZ8_EXST2|nr:uncharacterized protein SETTUDRAFT_175630 [Exserohilum turcica Et28A]EOA89607.1 hypothetical protein SETTUDRAFT_175630 [Exserohilum turcica Et28A]
MRRPPLACRRAVQSLQLPTPHHIWISDDLLALALNRFFRSSCPHQRRHGSHVPGPLEARRRAAKRRMTVSAGFYPPDHLSSLFNLGALFGFRKDTQPTWRYEAPTLQQRADTLDRQEHPASASSHPFAFPNPFSQSYDQTKSQTHGARVQSDGLEESPEPATDAIGDLDQTGVHTAHFDHFKSQVAHAGDLSSSERSRLLATTWRSCRPDHPDAWVYNTMVVEHLNQLGWDPTSILCKLKAFHTPPTYTLHSLYLLNCLEKSWARFLHASKVYHRVCMKMAEAAKSAEASRSSSQDAELLLIIRLALHGAVASTNEIKRSVAESLVAVADKIQNLHVRKSLRSILTGTNTIEQCMNLFLARAATDYSVCAAVEQVLSCLPPKRLESIVPSITLSLATAVERKNKLPGDIYARRLDAWLMVLEGLGAPSASDEGGTALLEAAIAAVTKHIFTGKNPGMMQSHLLTHVLAFQLTRQTSYVTVRERMLQLTYACIALARAQPEPLGFEATLGLVFSRLRGEKLPYEALIDVTADVFARHASLHSVYCFLSALSQQGLGLNNASSIESLATKTILSSTQDPKSMDERARQRHAFTLHTCQRILSLVSKLSPSSPTPSLSTAKHHARTLQAHREFTEILTRAAQNHALPQIYANLSSTNLTPSQRSILIHQLAHFYSLTTTRSHRESWRAIYYLYRHLQAHALPIGPLFSKAVVRASMTRPMMEHRFISARRLIWVCHLVARVEGEHVVRQIEHGYWVWRGALIQHAKRVQDDAGGDRREKALVARIKALGLI